MPEKTTCSSAALRTRTSRRAEDVLTIDFEFSERLLKSVE
jgi:hypothetical protein